MRFLRQSTATVIEVGPFVDDTDGKTLEEVLAVASIDVQLMQPLDTAAVPPDKITNGTFAADSDWTKNSWTISGGVANSAAAQSTSLTQSLSITENVAYELVFDVATQSAGSVQPILGITAGTSRSTVATFTETIIAGSGSLIDFDATGFTGTIDNVVLKQVPIPITPAASGSSNDMVLTQSNTGTYWLELTANQVGIVGRHKLTAFISGALIVWEEFMVLEESVYDGLFAASGAIMSPASIANIQLMYDTTGYTDQTAPASRGQVDAIGAASGGSVNIAVSEDNTSAAIDPGSTTKVWATVAGTFANTEADNGLSHDFTDSGNDISHVYGFQVGGGRLATSVSFIGNVDGNNDEMQIEVWDHVGADWEVIGTILGTGATINKTLDLPLLLKHTGTSASEIGKVYIQMDTNSTTPSDLSVELLLVSAVNIGQTGGYALGQIWINTDASNTNTEIHVDGVSTNPVSTLAAAKTLSNNSELNLSDFHIINGSSITLAESTDNESYFGDEWTLALGGQSCAKAHFDGATVSGIATGSGNSFHRGEVQTVTLGDEFHITEAGLSGTITLPAGSGAIFNCHHDGASAPIMDFGDAVGSTTLHVHSYNGGIEMQNMGDSGADIVHLDGNGKLIINANCVGGTINVRGNWEVVDSAGGAVTINKDDLNSGIIYGDAETGTLSTTQCTSSLVGFTDDQLIGRVIIFLEGPADGEASPITDYASASGLITFEALTLAPENGNAFKLV